MLGSNFFLYNTARTKMIKLVASSGNAHIPVSNGFIPIWSSNSTMVVIIKAGKIADVKLIRATTKVVKNNAKVTKFEILSYLLFLSSKGMSYHQVCKFSTR